jgi:hypothetical protein
MSEHSAELHTNTEHARNRCVRLLYLLLLLGLTLVSTAINRLVPKDSNGVQRTNVRVGWYLRSGQWHADVRTLAAAFQYLMTPDTKPADGGQLSYKSTRHRGFVLFSCGVVRSALLPAALDRS